MESSDSNNTQNLGIAGALLAYRCAHLKYLSHFQINYYQIYKQNKEETE